MEPSYNLWAADRIGKLTASNISRLMKSGRKKDQLFGDAAMTYINEVIAEIITGEKKDDISGMRALQWGSDNEYDAVLTFQEHSGYEVEYFGVNNPKFFKYNAFSGGSPDGLHESFVLEIKCPYNTANHINFLVAAKAKQSNAWLAENNPDYYAQCMFNMLCTGKERAYLGSYDPRTLNHNHRLAIIPIVADAEFQADLKHRITEAAKIISSTLELLDRPSVLIATPITNGILVEKA